MENNQGERSFKVSGNLVDVCRNRILPGTITVLDGRIAEIAEEDQAFENYLMPGFVDAHIHIESSLLVPSEFARLAVAHGTVAVVCDPHEIGNVLGVAGVDYMLENGRQTPFKFAFGAPSCVPATGFETAGARIGVEEIGALLSRKEIGYLSEMMNFPGVLHRDFDVMERLRLAQEFGKPVDGHAPGLRGAAAASYFQAGISTDHECYTEEEAREKLELGVRLLIREGSAARNFEALYRLIDAWPERCMFCSDDKHPDELVRSHIDALARRAIQSGVELMNALRCACVNPVRHYGLDVGLLQPGDPADFIEVDGLETLRVLRTYIQGSLVARSGVSLLPHVSAPTINRFARQPVSEEELRVSARGTHLRVIEAINGQIVTGRGTAPVHSLCGLVHSDTVRDVLKIVVVNRYRAAPPAVGFVRGFGLQRGAIASSVAHDSHNVVAVGVGDDALCQAINAVIRAQGGLAAACGDETSLLQLPVAGLMSAEDGFEVAGKYADLDRFAKQLGTPLASPYMTLSFMALLVIPSLKMSDLGLFDGERFELVSLFV